MHIYGTHPTEELLKVAPDQIEAIYCDDPYAKRFEEVRRLVEASGLRLEEAARSRLDELSEGGNHQGIVVVTRPFRYAKLGELIDATEDEKRACLLVLDQIQDPHNLGAILRSAAAMGVDGAIIPKDRAAGVTGAVVRASAGQALRVPVARVTNITRTLEELKEHHFWAAGAAADQEASDLWQTDFRKKIALVMGGEHGGMRRLVGETCDFWVRIPMAAGVESLNVASAASIMLYEVRRQWSEAAE